MVELTQKLAWYDLVWVLLDGWLLFDDGREYALQSPWAWEQSIRDAGFAHVDWSESTHREFRSSVLKVLTTVGRFNSKSMSETMCT